MVLVLAFSVAQTTAPAAKAAVPWSLKLLPVILANLLRAKQTGFYAQMPKSQ